jgi:imidazolonepropionase-like amidohydrolase
VSALPRLVGIVIAFAVSGAAASETVAITGADARLATATGRIHNATIVVRDGRIVAVGADVAPPSGSRTIDAGGHIVTPGLMSARSQLATVEVEGVSADDGAVSGALGAAFDVEYALNANSTSLAVARADGLTRAVTVPSHSAEAPFDGIGALLRLDESHDLIERPRAGLFVTIGGMEAARVGGSRAAQWGLLRRALDDARVCRAEPRDCRTAGPGHLLQTRVNREALVPVLEGRVPLAIVAARESDIRAAIRLAEDYKVRVIVYGGAEAWRVAPLLAAHRIAVVLDPFANVPATFDEIGARPDNAAILEQAGVLIAFEVHPFFATHNAGLILREAAGIAVANGLPWDAALKALTCNPARIWGLDDHYGAIAVGQEADLVIWDGDPLEPASRAQHVLVRGREVSLRTRQTELRDRYAPARVNDPWPPAYR